jgi:hypothetical protein
MLAGRMVSVGRPEPMAKLVAVTLAVRVNGDTVRLSATVNHRETC